MKSDDDRDGKPAGPPQSAGLGTDPTMLPVTGVSSEIGEAAPTEGLEGQLVAGRYQVEKRLGSGGMGNVYRVRHVRMRKTFALKVLHREMTHVPEVVARFEREAVAAARIDHPNVAAAIDFGKLEDGSFYLVLEFVQGRSLRSLLNAEGPLPAERAVRIVRQIASALGAASATGIVHRDLKPDNVMLVERDDATDTVKVLDFGIARVTVEDNREQRALTQIGSVFGTPEYMSCEQAAGRAVDHRSDLYSLGILLYEMLSGTTPFRSDNTMGVLCGQLTAEPPPLLPQIAPGLSAVVMRLLVKDVERRLQSADELIRALDQLCPASVAVPVSQAGGRSPAASAAATALAALSRLSWARQIVSATLAATGSLRTRLRSAVWLQKATESLRNLGPSLTQAFPVLQRPIRVGTWPIPVWAALLAIGAAHVGTVLLVVVIGVVGWDDAAAPKPLASTGQLVSATAPPQVEPAAADAERARQQVERIEALPVYKRTYQDWLELARSQAQLGRHQESVLAYRAVLSLRRSSRNDPTLLADLRRAGEHPDSYQQVINLCETVLRKNGLDLLYDLWLGTRSDPSQRKIAELTIKKLEILRGRASPALRVAIALHLAKRCSTIKKLLPRAAKTADQRSVERLSKLAKTTGCGPDQAQDCYPCLRTDSDLSVALAQARSRQAPKFDRARP